MLVRICTLRYLAYVIVVRCVLLQVVVGKDWLRMVMSSMHWMEISTVHWVVRSSVHWVVRTTVHWVVRSIRLWSIEICIWRWARMS